MATKSPAHLSTQLAYRHINLTQAKPIIEQNAQGHLIVRSSEALQEYPERMLDRLIHWAAVAPERTFMAKRVNGDNRGGDWRHVTYQQALDAARRIGQYLHDQGASVERPVAILSDNDLEHALIALGAQYAGVPFAPISPAYSLVSQDYEKLRHVFNVLTPSIIFAADGCVYAKAISAVAASDTQIIVTRNPSPDQSNKTILFADVLATVATPAIDAVYKTTGPDTIAKFLFTSGSTKLPKAVINTQRMLCCNMQQFYQAYPFLGEEPPVLVDWLPWNHTFGGNQIVGIIVYFGGTLYIDEGKPTPKGMAETLRNLREISPTVYFNVPKGFEEVALALRREPELAKKLLGKLKMFYYAGASLSQPVWDSLFQTAEELYGERVGMLTGLGMTETAPSALIVNRVDCRAGMIGIPVPGLKLKLIQDGDKLEARYRGPNITPGYWRAPNETRESFDEDGFFITGDAIKYIDPTHPELGFMFDGRIAEDFKLDTGTWVSVGPLRGKVIASGAPYVQDVVVTGHDRGDLGILIFPHIESCRQLCGLDVDASVTQVLAHPNVWAEFERVVNDAWKTGTGSANRIARAMVLVEPPSLDKGEITDKGSINQRAVLKQRAILIEQLYAAQSSSDIIRPKGERTAA